MGENSTIVWTHHTFSPWWGCTHISEECVHCYAETWAKRWGVLWGKDQPRRFFPNDHWQEPERWARRARRLGVRQRVFCGSMCDIAEDRDDLVGHRLRLLDLITRTADALDWLLLTKLPANLLRMFPPEVTRLCWVGTTVGTQKAAIERLGDLERIEARVHFASCEPLLERVYLTPWMPTLQWVIVGGERHARARPFDLEWVRVLRNECALFGVPFLFKQDAGPHPTTLPLLDGQRHDAVPLVAA